MIKGCYKCECGKEFDNPQKFNGHKSHCKIHAIDSGKLAAYEECAKVRGKHAADSRKVKLEQKRLDEKLKWKSEQHRCEVCGKLMSEKYGCGRFCSRKCANSAPRISRGPTKEESIRKLKVKKHDLAVSAYQKNPKHCKLCDEILPWENRRNQYCSSCKKTKSGRQNKHEDVKKICPVCGSTFSVPYISRCKKYCCENCVRIGQSQTRKQLFADGKLTHHSVKGIYHYGTYKNIVCDSSWELAFVMYLIDHNIPFERNWTRSFVYELNGEKHRFIPDFLVKDTVYEIKGKRDEISEAKERCIPKNVKFKIMYYADIKKYLKYAKDAYGKNFDTLYDPEKPSWLDKNREI